MVEEKINLGGISFTSEWFDYQLLQALFNDSSISNKFNLSWVAGRESDFKEAEKRILDEIIAKSTELGETIGTPDEWRVSNTTREGRNLFTLLDMINTGVVGYQRMNRGGNDLPIAAYDSVDTVAIFTPNALHVDYIEDGLYFGRNVLCEKPLAVVTDITGVADRRNLDKLIELDHVRKGKGLVVMDAEHYSSKIASKVFFDHIDDMVDNYGKIVEVKGYLEEKDNPLKRRTKKLLCKENQTGLLLDTGVHPLSMITGIGGKFWDIDSAVYGMHPKYDVETAADVKLRASGDYFDEKILNGVPVELYVGKFILEYGKDKINEKKGRDKTDEIKEKKQMEFTFEKDGKETTVTVNFRNGEVTDTLGVEWHKKPMMVNYSKIEYVNILNELYNCIQNKTEPRTKLANSIEILDAIFRTYRDFPVDGNNLDKGWYRCP